MWLEIAEDQNVDISSLNGFNLKEYYDSIIKFAYSLKVKTITGILPRGNRDYKKVIKEYENLSSQIAKLKEDYSAATMRAEKLKIDDDLYDKEQELKALIKQIKGGN